MLDQFAETAERDGWNGPILAAYLDEWIGAGVEPAAAVLEIVHELAVRPDLSQAEVAAKLREQADRIEREAMETDA